MRKWVVRILGLAHLLGPLVPGLPVDALHSE